MNLAIKLKKVIKMKNRMIYCLAALLLGLMSVVAVGCTEEETYIEELTTASLSIERSKEQYSDQLTVTIKPNINTASFTYAIGTDADRESFENGSYKGIRKQLGNEELTYTFTYLEPNTVYTVFAQAFDKDDAAHSVATLKVTTYTDNFKVEVDYVGVKSAAISFDSSFDYYKYIYAVGKPGDKEAFINGTLEGIKEKVEYTHYTVNLFDLEPETDYVFYAMGYDRTDKPTKVFEFPVTTLSAELYPTMTFRYDDQTSNLLYSNYSLTFNEACSKVGVLVVERGSYREQVIDVFWEGRLLEMLHVWAGINNLDTQTKNPNFSFQKSTVGLFRDDDDPFDKEYDVYGILYDQNGYPFAAERFEYKNQSYDANAEASVVDLEITDITSEGATYNFSTNSATFGFAFETFDADSYDMLVGEGIWGDKEIKEYLKTNFYYGAGKQTFIEKSAEYGGQRLYVVIGGINTNGYINGMSDFVIKEYTTALAE